MIFGHIFCKDPIDIHEQIYGTVKLLYSEHSRDQKKCSLYGGVHPRGVRYVGEMVLSGQLQGFCLDDWPTHNHVFGSRSHKPLPRLFIDIFVCRSFQPLHIRVVVLFPKVFIFELPLQDAIDSANRNAKLTSQFSLTFGFGLFDKS